METEAHTSWVHFPKITLLVNDSLEAKLGSDSCAGDLAPGLHHHKCTLTGENKLGTKMEVMGRKYATACAKINYKTFTFLMRSWNSSKNQWPAREGLDRHAAGKQTAKDHFCPWLLLSLLLFHQIPVRPSDTSSTNGCEKNLWAQLKSHFFHFELYSQRSVIFWVLCSQSQGYASVLMPSRTWSQTPLFSQHMRSKERPRPWNTHFVGYLYSRKDNSS